MEAEGGKPLEHSQQSRLANGPGSESPFLAESAIGYERIISTMAPTLARTILTVVFCAIGGLSVLSLVLALSDPAQIALGITYLVAMVGFQLAFISLPTVRHRRRLLYSVLIVQAGLAYLPMLQFGEVWLGLPGFLVGSVLLTLRPSFSLPLAAAIVLSMGLLGVVFDRPLLSTGHLLVSSTITGLVVYGLTRLVRLVSDLHAAREELARMAVAEERLRFARDVHDLVGFSLSAIILKCEIVERFITDYPERAREELVEVLEVARKAAADARSVARGSHDLSLDEEFRAALSVLTAADVDVRIDWDHRELPVQVGSVLATVLREGITNVLRHSKAEACEIKLWCNGGVARLEIVNDGVAQVPAPIADVDGSGIRNLSRRLGLVGGDLETESEPPGSYRLRATVPLPPR